MKSVFKKRNFGSAISKKHQHGFTLIELAIIVVIVGIIAAYVVPMLTGIKDKNVTVNQEFSAMQRTVSQIYDRYFNDVIDDSNVNNSEVIAARLQSEAYRHNGSDQIFNIFGGNIVINGLSENGLEFESQKIPTNVCSALVSLTKGKLPFETVDIAGTEVRLSDADAIQQITAACDAVTADNMTIIWTISGTGSGPVLLG